MKKVLLMGLLAFLTHADCDAGHTATPFKSHKKSNKVHNKVNPLVGHTTMRAFKKKHRIVTTEKGNAKLGKTAKSSKSSKNAIVKPSGPKKSVRVKNKEQIKKAVTPGYGSHAHSKTKTNTTSTGIVTESALTSLPNVIQVQIDKGVSDEYRSYAKHSPETLEFIERFAADCMTTKSDYHPANFFCEYLAAHPDWRSALGGVTETFEKVAASVIGHSRWEHGTTRYTGVLLNPTLLLMLEHAVSKHKAASQQNKPSSGVTYFAPPPNDARFDRGLFLRNSDRTDVADKFLKTEFKTYDTANPKRLLIN